MAGPRDDGTFAEDKAHHPNRKVGPNRYSVSFRDADEMFPAGWLVDMVSDRGAAGHPHYTSDVFGSEEEANNWAQQNYGTDRLPNNYPRTQ